MSDSIFLTDGNGVLTGLVDINYSGELIIHEYVGSERITSIGKQVFKECHGLTSITIPNSITSIGEYAFMGCGNLTSVTIPDSVTSIGEAAFTYCGLTSITIPNSITNFGMGVFGHCYDLTSVIIQDGITSIGDYAFEQCSSLTSIIIPDSVTSIGRGLFSYCTNLTSITIPNSITNIGKQAFNRCTGLTSVVIPDSVIDIGEKAFNYCYGLTSVTIPNSVTSIGDEAFGSCTGLTSIYVQNPKELSLAVSSYDWSGTHSNITFKLDPRYDTSYLIKNSTLISLADKIRVLSGTEETMTPAEMQSELDTFNTGMSAVVSEQDNLIAQIATALEGKTAPSTPSGASINTCTITIEGFLGRDEDGYCVTRFVDGEVIVSIEKCVSENTKVITDVVCGSFLFAAVYMGCYSTVSGGVIEIGTQYNPPMELWNQYAGVAMGFIAPKEAGANGTISIISDYE